MRRFVVLAFLYAAQGLPFGFFSHAVPVLLNRSQPAKIVGLSSLLAVPWAMKFLFGPFVDRARRRRRVIVPLNLACVASLVLLGLARPSADHMAPLLAGFFIVSLFSAMQDVATDGLAIDLLAPAERGAGGSVQVAAQRTGIIAGGGGVLAIIDAIGYREAFFLMAAAIALFTLPVLWVDEPTRAPAARLAERPWGLLRTFFSHPDAKKILGLTLAFKLGDALAAGMVSRFFVKQGLSNAEIALSRGTVGGAAAVAGAIAGGALFRVLGARSALLLTVTLQTAAIALYAVLELVHPSAGTPMPIGVYIAASAVEHALGGAATAALFARMMDLCREEARATDYTVQACVVVLVTGLGILASGFVTDALGLLGLFVVATVLGVLAPFGVVRFWIDATPGRQARALERA